MSLVNGGTCPKCGALSPESPCSLTGWSLTEYVIFCNVFWWISYCFLILLAKQSEEWCCRLLTFVHGCIISVAAIRDVITNERVIAFKSGSLSETQKNYLSFMLSYFLFDFCWFHFFGNEPWVIYFHHCTSILIIVKILVGEYGGGGISYAVAGLEFTNPYLQLRWFLRTHGYLNSPIHTAVELWFFLLFSVIRTFGGSILFYYAAVSSEIDIAMKIAFTSIYLISLVLQWQIIIYWKKKYWKGNRRNFPRSRVSISQYFQRKTLDRSDTVDSGPDEVAAKTPQNSIYPSTEILKESPDSNSAKTPQNSISPSTEILKEPPDSNSAKTESFSAEKGEGEVTSVDAADADEKENVE